MLNNNIITFRKESCRQSSYENLHNGKLIDGVFSIIKKDLDGNLFLARDKYGIKKIFYIIKKNKAIASENFLDLHREIKSSEIYSLKPGYSFIYNKAKNKKVFRRIKYKSSGIKKKFSPILAKKKILKTLNEIKKIEKINECNVLLSGGLDSTIIAYLAKKVFKKVNAITCVFLSVPDYKLYKKNGYLDFNNYSDFVNAKAIAKKLKINFYPIIKPLPNILANIEKVMYLIQDWRDFNVHCGVLNFEISKYLLKSTIKDLPIFSGDFMNECFADYESEIIGNKEYYKQLNVSTSLRSKFLIDGLQTSDRENGIFSKTKLRIYQPYYCLLDDFKSLNKKFFKKYDKYSFMGKILTHEILNLVGKKKRRAQITDNDGGILNYFIRNKINQKKLLTLFSKKNNLKISWIKKLIVFGKYLEE